MCFLALQLSELNFPDPDAFHEMALAREVVKTGNVPTQDLFAYTPTVTPVVHHEWGTGMVLYFATKVGGASALVAVRYTLAFSTFALAAYIALGRGGTWTGIAMASVLAAGPLAKGFATVRAQDFTLLFTCILLAMLEGERTGRRAWLCVWPIIYVVWLNLHGGFVAGVALFAVYVAETAARRRGQHIAPLLISLALMIPLTLVNPYGFAYPRYILHAVSMPRPQITEWAPIWQADPSTLAAFAAICALYLYCLWRNGWRRCEGVLMVAAALAMTAMHLRHVSLAALVALCYLPAWLRMTPFGVATDNLCTEKPTFVTISVSAAATVCIVCTIRNTPWRLPIPANGEDWVRQEPVVYPAGACDYLHDNRIAANVMTPFTVGGFVSWECYPFVKVSIDGRYEVAYEPSLLTESLGFYRGNPGWVATLERYRTDLVLVPHPSHVRTLLGGQAGWSCVYGDDAYELWARPGLVLPVTDRRGRHIEASIP